MGWGHADYRNLNFDSTPGRARRISRRARRPRGSALPEGCQSLVDRVERQQRRRVRRGLRVAQREHLARLDERIAVSLEDLADHFYRHLEAKLDLSLVRDWTRELYTDRGRPSIDPVVIFKLQLVMVFEGIRCERQRMQVMADRLSLR